MYIYKRFNGLRTFKGTFNVLQLDHCFFECPRLNLKYRRENFDFQDFCTTYLSQKFFDFNEKQNKNKIIASIPYNILCTLHNVYLHKITLRFCSEIVKYDL